MDGVAVEEDALTCYITVKCALESKFDKMHGKLLLEIKDKIDGTGGTKHGVRSWSGNPMSRYANEDENRVKLSRKDASDRR